MRVSWLRLPPNRAERAPPTQADKRAFTQRGKVEERRADETVSIDFPASEQTEATRTDVGSSDAD